MSKLVIKKEGVRFTVFEIVPEGRIPMDWFYTMPDAQKFKERFQGHSKRPKPGRRKDTRK